MSMSHEEYMAQRLSRWQAIAQNVLDGKMDPVDGCLELFEGAHETFPEFREILDIHSELDHIPRGAGETLASDEFKRRLLKEKEELSKFYGEAIIAVCRKIVDKKKL
ncbi:MAG: hypothetical protein HY079_05875 [Elusimicrobia bacterium]|nr:hypothetical protein [Elusimicrobiota bacterium]